MWMFPPFRTRWWKVICLFLVIIRIYKMRKVQSWLDEQELTSNLGLEKARVWEIKVMRFFVLIRLGITSIGLSLYIYRPGKTYPFTSRITWGLFTKNLILLGLYRPDRSARPVRPVDLSRCQIWLSTLSFTRNWCVFIVFQWLRIYLASLHRFQWLRIYLASLHRVSQAI